jgi:hypothetical protein
MGSIRESTVSLEILWASAGETFCDGRRSAMGSSDSDQKDKFLKRAVVLD